RALVPALGRRDDEHAAPLGAKREPDGAARVRARAPPDAGAREPQGGRGNASGRLEVRHRDRDRRALAVLDGALDADLHPPGALEELGLGEVADVVTLVDRRDAPVEVARVERAEAHVLQPWRI